METSSTENKTSSSPQFEIKLITRLATLPGGFFHVLIDGHVVCECQYWAFSSCGVATLFGFSRHRYLKDGPKNASGYLKTNWDLIIENHDALFKFLWGKSCGDSWYCREYLMVLSTTQVREAGGMLNHPNVKMVDHFLNKAHGPNHLHMYRISMDKDFK